MSKRIFPLAPGSWLGMIGGGQLGRMFCHAAQRLGYRVMVLDPDPHSPAGTVADRHIQAHYDAPEGLAQLQQHCHTVSTEFENVPAPALAYFAKSIRVSPSAAALQITQDRIQEKAFIERSGIDVVPYIAVRNIEDIANAPQSLFPGILKTARLGYDGKGQYRVANQTEAVQAWQRMQEVPCVLEAMVNLGAEISVVIARDIYGHVAVYDPTINQHRDGILFMSTAAPDLMPPPLIAQARQHAETLARELNYCGVMCVEFFVLNDHNGRLVVNEIAPRPHNSGHYSIEACPSSQFDQQVRVMAGLPLGDTQVLRPAVMLNLLGDLWFDKHDQLREPDWASILGLPEVHLHLYGKTQARKGRKMGHITVTGDALKLAMATVKSVMIDLEMS